MSFLVALLTLASLGCDSNARSTTAHVAKSDAPNDAEPTAHTLIAELEKAYRSNSGERLTAFLRRWQDSVQPVPVDEVTDPLERTLHEVYIAFFDPFSLEKLAGQFSQDSHGIDTFNSTYESVDYVIVPTSLRFHVANGEERMIRDFRPAVRVQHAGVLFLTPIYREALTRFLDGDSGSEGEDAQIYGPLQRLQFLNSHVHVEMGQWPGWDLLSYPDVYCVKLTDDYMEANVSFSMFNMGGMATMEHKSDGWSVKQSGIAVIW